MTVVEKQALTCSWLPSLKNKANTVIIKVVYVFYLFLTITNYTEAKTKRKMALFHTKID